MYALYWLIAVGAFLLIEILTLGLTSIWFAGGALVAWIGALLDAPLLVQFILFIVVSCILFFFTRPIAQKYFNSSVEKTNAEALVGQHTVVAKAISNDEGTGSVHINGMDWSARSFHGEDIDEGTRVVIHEIQGVKLMVSPLEEKEN